MRPIMAADAHDAMYLQSYGLVIWVFLLGYRSAYLY